MKLKHLLFSSLMLLSAGTAWADVEINETNFPDANFRNYLLEQDYGSDGKLTNAEIAGVTLIVVSSKSIQNLKGIEYFTALKTLYCSGNQLTSLDVSKNTELKYLDCDNNQLTSLYLSGCTALTTLRCYSNQLASLDVSGCTSLWDLYCNNNQLTSLNLSKNIALVECYNNQITSLDVLGCTALGWLDCSSNQLTSLDVSKNTALYTLICDRNKLNGKNMDAIVESLPTITIGIGTLRVIYFENEQNVMTTTQVAAAKAKGWIPYYYNGTNWSEYEGVAPATKVDAVETSEADDSAPWYTINGVELTEKPTAPGIYIHGGKKVVVK